MSNWDFIILLSENIQDFILIAISLLLIYYLLFRKWVLSILDPLFLSLLGSSLGFAVVLFLYHMNSISLYYLFNYLLTQFSFLLFLFWGLNFKFEIVNPLIKIKDEPLFLLSFFIVASLTDFFCQIYVFRISGFPIFFDSRLETFVGGTGYGLFSRFIEISRMFSLYFACFYLFSITKKKNIICFYIYSYLGFFILSSVLSGSKSAILLIGYVVYCYIIANRDQINISLLKRYIKLILSMAIAGAVIVIYSKSGNLIVAISELASRFVYYGDIYWQAYPGNSMEMINKSNPMYALFSDFLGFFRIVSWNELPQPMGIDLYQLHQSSDILTGPNARHNVFGLFNFGYIGSILFSSIIGLIVGLSRKSISSFSKHTHLLKSLVIIVFLKVIAFETDPTLVISGLDSILMAFPFLLILSCFLYFLLRKSACIYCHSQL